MTSDHFRGYWEIEFARRTEGPFRSALLDAVDAGTVVYDVGANVGFYACLLGRIAAEVHAFEPNPHAAADLRRNVASNGLDTVSVHETAVSDASGRRYLTGRGSPNGRSEISETPTGLAVQSVTLDELETEPPDVVKIDVEGHERAVLEGMGRLLESHQPAIFCEIHGVGADVTELLTAHGYAVDRIGDRFDGTEFIRASVDR
ncbi:FkbM family methyltransferase [Salinigranum salinum]|uniref:FkbM family methyltransferase n=1 Tax=Salinigranum salinum TaxID=1364937 RepID=UPI001864DAA2|nr:FkbM family methyltransferase [Salinigranum salinum]